MKPEPKKKRLPNLPVTPVGTCCLLQCGAHVPEAAIRLLMADVAGHETSHCLPHAPQWKLDAYVREHNRHLAEQAGKQ